MRRQGAKPASSGGNPSYDGVVFYLGYFAQANPAFCRFFHGNGNHSGLRGFTQERVQDQSI